MNKAKHEPQKYLPLVYESNGKIKSMRKCVKIDFYDSKAMFTLVKFYIENASDIGT